MNTDTNTMNITIQDREYRPSEDLCHFRTFHRFPDGSVARIAFCGDYEHTGKLRCYVKRMTGGDLPFELVAILTNFFQQFVNSAGQKITLLYGMPDRKELCIHATPQTPATITVQ